ncbi:hypothetical protein COLO4_20939 [Corchorus olitorius]|uniref:Uncharacterized protein n=1 Tax=Corchorus olitorius TaxID=93759 RepID=A0A1R3IVZ8_9ROSI|nr:hypothetical protein COLO4_20939 [Corchorus olitorius]
MDIKGQHPHDPCHNPIWEIQMMETGPSDAPRVPRGRQAVFYQDPPIFANGILDIKPFYNRLLTLPPDSAYPTDIIQALLEYQRNPYKFLGPPQAFIVEDLPADMGFQGLVSSLPQKMQDMLALFSIRANAKELFKFQSIIIRKHRDYAIRPIEQVVTENEEKVDIPLPPYINFPWRYYPTEYQKKLWADLDHYKGMESWRWQQFDQRNINLDHSFLDDSFQVPSSPYWQYQDAGDVPYLDYDPRFFQEYGYEAFEKDCDSFYWKGEPEDYYKIGEISFRLLQVPTTSASIAATIIQHAQIAHEEEQKTLECMMEQLGPTSSSRAAAAGTMTPSFPNVPRN